MLEGLDWTRYLLVLSKGHMNLPILPTQKEDENGTGRNFS